MIDHAALSVSDYARSRAFYQQALAPLGYSLLMEFSPEQTGGRHFGGFGKQGFPSLWIASADKEKSGPVHIAIAAADKATVDAFHKAAVAAGAKDNGPPGPRPHYHAGYYGAFVLDPDGNNIEAVCHNAG